MRVSRNTVYSLFKKEAIEPATLFLAGNILNHDFCEEIPSLNESEFFQVKKTQKSKEERDELLLIQRDYYELLKKQNKLVNLLLKISQKHSIPEIKQYITGMLD